MIIFQLVLFCGLFILLVRCSAIGGAKNALYFYPKEYQETAYARGIADREIISKKRTRFMIPFCIAILLAIVCIVGLWNRADSFRSAYLQSLLFLEVMTWFDGIVVDRLWVGHSPFWIIPGMEGIPFVQSWKAVLKKRGILTVIWVILATIPAGLALLLARL